MDSKFAGRLMAAVSEDRQDAGIMVEAVYRTPGDGAGTPHGRVVGIAESIADVSDVWAGEIRSRSVIQFPTQALQIASQPGTDDQPGRLGG